MDKEYIYVSVCEYYSAFRKKMLSFVTAWMKLEGIALNKPGIERHTV
jgi:hypothetical protein